MKLICSLLATIVLGAVGCATQSPPPPSGPRPGEAAAFQDLDRETAKPAQPEAPPADPAQ